MSDGILSMDLGNLNIVLLTLIVSLFTFLHIPFFNCFFQFCFLSFFLLVTLFRVPLQLLGSKLQVEEVLLHAGHGHDE